MSNISRNNMFKFHKDKYCSYNYPMSVKSCNKASQAKTVIQN